MTREANLSGQDQTYLRRAIQLARLSEAEGNLPIGAVITLDGEIIAEGRNHIWSPVLAASRHAEMEALRAVPPELWPRCREMTLYTTLEPCMMCAGAILLHHIGRLAFGAKDEWAGAGFDTDRWPPYFQERARETQWEGPAMPGECDPLYQRARALIARRLAAQTQEQAE